MLIVLTVLSLTGIAYWRLRDLFYYSNDDLLQFQVADQAGLGNELLWMNVFSHVAPVNRFGHFLTFQGGRLDPDSGLVFSAVLVAGLLATVAWLTYELRMTLIRRMFVLVIGGGSAALLFCVIWCDGAWHSQPALIATYATVALHIRAIRTNQRKLHVLCIAVFTVGILTQTRAAFALPLAVLFDLLLVWRDLSWRARWHRLFLVRAPLLAMAAIGAAAAMFLAPGASGDDSGLPVGMTLRVMLGAFSMRLLPQLAGLPISGSTNILVELLLLGLLIALLLKLAAHQRNRGPILLLISVFAMYWSFLVFSPMLEDGASDELGYAIYPMFPVLIAICSLEIPGAKARLGRLSPHDRLVAAVVALAAVFGWVIASTSVFAATSLDAPRAAHDFVEGASSTSDIWSEPEVSLVLLQAPEAVANSWATPRYGREEFLLPLIAPGWRPGHNFTGNPMFLDSSGQVKRAALKRVAGPMKPTAAGSSTGSCPGSGPSLSSVSLPSAVVGEPFVAKISYVGTTAGQLTVASGPNRATKATSWPTPLSAGNNTVVVTLPSRFVGSIEMSFVPGGSGSLCATSVEVLRPLLQDGSNCHLINRFGDTQEPTTCPGIEDL